MKVLAIAGSLREQSFNRGLIRAAQALAPAGMEIIAADISDVLDDTSNSVHFTHFISNGKSFSEHPSHFSIGTDNSKVFLVLNIPLKKFHI